MRYSSATLDRVLAIDPSPRGFGFAVMEGPQRLIDWGTKGVNGDKNRQSLKHVAELIERYCPDVIVIEDCQHKSARRTVRVRNLLNDIVLIASSKLRVRRIPRLTVKKTFTQDGAGTKHQVATEIAKRFPELAPLLPPVRKPWMSEDNRMSIFDAVSLALTYCASPHD
jgi:Holliday junction resolvasome RuvABC endonuclease subunit